MTQAAEMTTTPQGQDRGARAREGEGGRGTSPERLEIESVCTEKDLEHTSEVEVTDQQTLENIPGDLRTPLGHE